MSTSDDSQTEQLFAAVTASFNHADEVTTRTREATQGLSETEIRLIQPLSAQSRVLDIGCAAGRASLALARQGHTVVGVDVASSLLEQASQVAQTQGVEATFQRCDSLTLPFAKGAFDAALALKTYCYIPTRRNRATWLEEVARVLRPGGWLFLSQYVLDDTGASYEVIHEDTSQRFPEWLAGLEPGDGFALGDTPTYVHYFMEADLRAELTASPFVLSEAFQHGDLYYYALQCL